jgi:hypothetical protein
MDWEESLWSAEMASVSQALCNLLMHISQLAVRKRDTWSAESVSITRPLFDSLVRSSKPAFRENKMPSIEMVSHIRILFYWFACMSEPAFQAEQTHTIERACYPHRVLCFWYTTTLVCRHRYEEANQRDLPLSYASNLAYLEAPAAESNT